MKKILMTIAVVFCLVSIGKAQSYTTGVGLRGGLSGGVTIKHFVSSNTAIEGIVSTRWKGLNLTGLYEIHAQAFDVRGLNWYYGFGGHIGFWNGKYASWANDDKSYSVVGLDGILGLEYKIAEIPISLSADWKPMLNIFGHSGFWTDGGAISVKYVF